MGELIDLDKKRQEKWIRTLEEKRELGEVAIFGVVGPVDAKILPFKKESPQ